MGQGALTKFFFSDGLLQSKGELFLSSFDEKKKKNCVLLLTFVRSLISQLALEKDLSYHIVWV
jgi:hypothetical protein